MGFFHGVVIERGAKKKKKERFQDWGRERSLIEREEGVGLARGPGALCTGHKPLPMSLPTRPGWQVTCISGALACMTLGLDSSRPTSTLAIHRPSDASGNLGFCHCRLFCPEGTVGTWTSGLWTPAQSCCMCCCQQCAIFAQMATYARSPQHCTADGCGMPVSFASLEIISHGPSPGSTCLSTWGLMGFFNHCPKPRETRDNARRLEAKCQSKWQMTWGPTSTLDVCSMCGQKRQWYCQAQATRVEPDFWDRSPWQTKTVVFSCPFPSFACRPRASNTHHRDAVRGLK